MRRAEMARRRRNLSEKRNEEVKVCLLVLLANTMTVPMAAREAALTVALDGNHQQAPEEAGAQDEPACRPSARRGQPARVSQA